MTAPEARPDTWTCGKCLVRYRVSCKPKRQGTDEERYRCAVPGCARPYATLDKGPAPVQLYIDPADLPVGACIVKGALP